MLVKSTYVRCVIFLTASIISSILIISCSKLKEPVSGSGDASGVTPAIGDVVFPHMAGWEQPEAHGKKVRSGGVTNTSACAASCHGENLEGGLGPSCKKCHELWPHDDGWKNSDKHGKFALGDNKTKCSTKCHGEDLSGGLSGVSCTTCHNIFPHANNFSDPAEHGKYAVGAKKNDCIACHGADWKGGDSGQTCFDCHNQLYPHTSGWSKKEEHGAWVSANSKGACATKCHGSDLAGGLSGVSCDACHTLWPTEHKKGTWASALHGKKFLGLGQGACLGCHGEDWKGGKTGYSCVQCHNSLPNHYNDDLWGETGHGKYALTLGGDYTDCKKCHGANLEGKTFGEIGVSDIPACSSCHGSYPYKHAALWKTTFGGHGAYLLNEKKTNNSALDECKKCHGDKLDGGGAGKSCFTCHTTYPHFEGWNTGHGAYFIANEKNKDTKTCATANCHGLNLKGNPEGVAIDQKLVYGCEDCHLKYPHPADWKHSLADPTLKKCKTCHGNNFEGKGNAPSCNSDSAACHKSFPSPHRTAPYEAASATWKKYGGHGDYAANTDANGKIVVDISGCKKCHGALFTGGSPGSNIKLSCYACHKSYPHPPTSAHINDGAGKKYYPFTDVAKWPTFDGGHGLYLAYKAKKSSTGQSASEIAKVGTGGYGCWQCHGDKLDGGISGKSCKIAACHPSYPHAYDGTWKQNAVDPTAAHGGYLMSGLQNLKDIYVKIQNECSSTYCHGSVGIANWKAPGCNDPKCHVEFPSQHKNEKWVTKEKDLSHAAVYKSGDANCAMCHGESVNFTYNSTPPAKTDAGLKTCYGCHKSYPHLEYVPAKNLPSQPWNNYVAHGYYYLVHKEDSPAPCSGCHGGATLIGIEPPATTDTGTTTCYNCHVYPHGTYTDIYGNGPSTWGLPDVDHVSYIMDHSDPEQIAENKCALSSCHLNGKNFEVFPIKTTWFMSECDYCHQKK